MEDVFNRAHKWLLQVLNLPQSQQDVMATIFVGRAIHKVKFNIIPVVFHNILCEDINF